ncbi:hypothetical protein CBI38_31870 (plasmid) [Rhodococcus oxybenzonivorans]|uniref:Uncharacterized protein n=1 Tax=Rhodococcus oxybenzonivorans TaxID=1990687 RepID=A0A2S2C5K6_9NOCA|nr:hypothetical protein CBI38_31870 [Rhodococcus oxybenzonivorans]
MSAGDPFPRSVWTRTDRAGRQHIDRTLAIPITTVATALAVPYQRIRRLEDGQRLDPDLAATYSPVVSSQRPNTCAR